MSERPQKLIVNCETGVSEYVNLTDEEIAFAQDQVEKFELEEARRQAELDEKNALKASARTKLVSGQPLTEEEAATIVL